MRKLLLFLTVIFTVQLLSAQVKFRVAIQPDLKTYNVYLRPDVSFSFPLNNVSSAQLTLRVGTGSFTPGNLTNFIGNWGIDGPVRAPEENNRYDYFNIALTTATRDIPIVEGEEVLLFSFENLGDCESELGFITNVEDPFWPDPVNSRNFNIGNQVGIAGLGFGVNGYEGEYYTGGYTCEHSSVLCGITYNGIDHSSPSSCGTTDGQIEIFASNDQGWDLLYSIDDGDTYQNSPVFTNLVSGDYHIVIRDVNSFCIEDVGIINVPGPLGPLSLGQDINHPDCGVNNGEIVVHARTDFGDPVEFSIDGGSSFQSDSIFADLEEGTYNFILRNTANGCTTTVGPIELVGCVPEPCVVYYEIERNADGRYQVVLLSDTTWTTPQNITSSLQVSFRAPTGQFTLDDLRSEVSNVSFGPNSTIVAPSESPGYDYFAIGLNTPGTQDISYVKGQKVILFSFVNSNDCQGGVIELVENGVDPYFSNSSNPDISQQLFTFGSGADISVCLNDNRSVPCESAPDPCLAEFSIEQTPSGTYQVTMTPDTTLAGASTDELTVTVKIPRGGFVFGQLASSTPGTTVSSTVEASAPAADPSFDYINVTIGPVGTSSVPYQKGQKVDLFTFKNIGSCAGNMVKVFDSETDAYSSATAGLFLKVDALGSDYVKTCLNDQSHPDCPPLSVKKDTVYVTMETDANLTECINSVLDLPNGIGNASTCGNGTFVTASVSNTSDCVELIPQGDFRETDEVCVIHCDATLSGVCDTTIIIICPQVRIQPVTAGCAGTDIQITTVGGAGTFTWTGGLSGQNPTASPSVTTTYMVTADDGNGCATNDEIEIVVNSAPVPTFTFAGSCSGQPTQFSNTTPGGASFLWDFGDNFGSSVAENPMYNYISDGDYTVSLTVTDAAGCTGTATQTVTMSSTADSGTRQEFTICAGDSIQFQAAGGTTYSWSPGDFLTADDIANPIAFPPRTTTYLVSASGSGTGCGTVDTFEVIVNLAPVISNVLGEDINDCDNPDGSIKIFASAGTDPIEYSIDCGVTWDTSSYFPNLDKDTYAPMVRNTVTGCTSTWSKNFVLTGAAAPKITNVTKTDPTTCGAEDGTISVEVENPDSKILEYSVDGGASWDTLSTVSDLASGNFDIMVRFQNEQCTAPYTGNPIMLEDAGVLPVVTKPVSEVLVCADDWKEVSIEIDYSIENYTITSTGMYRNESKIGNQLSFEVAAPVDSVEFSIELKAQDGCSVIEDFKVYKSDAPVLVAGEKEATECGKDEGFFLLTVQGGVAPFVFDFISDTDGMMMNDSRLQSNSAPFNDLASGDYTVELTDTVGCISSLRVNIEELATDFNFSESVVEPNCNEANGSIALTDGGVGLTFEWKNSDSQVISNNSSAADLPAGSYTVLISDTEGCSQELPFELDAIGAPELVLEQTMNVLCEGDANGGVAFRVNGSGEYSVSIQGMDRTIQGNESTMIFGLSGGTHEMIVTDAAGCSAKEEITIVEKVIELQTNNTVPGDCQATDGQLCLTMTGGDAPYDVRSDAGSMTGLAEGEEICFDNIASGIYSVEIEDASGCTKTQIVELEALNQPEVTDYAVEGLTCPEDLNTGTVIATGSTPLHVFDMNQNDLGETPVTGLAPGQYILTQSKNGCEAFETIELTVPEDWDIEVQTSPETCDGNDGTIEIVVSGANGGTYDFDWSTGVTAVSGTAVALNSQETYSVVIRDSEGCQKELTDLEIDYDCDDCDPLFEVENFSATVESSLPQVCLPLTNSDISDQDILLNGTAYSGFLSVCQGEIMYYDMADLMTMGTAPFKIEGLPYTGGNLTGFIFNTIEELMTELNRLSPSSNWRYDTDTQQLTAESEPKFFGDMVVSHAGSSNNIMLNRNEETVLRTSIEVPGEGQHTVVLMNAQATCSDTIYLNLNEDYTGPNYLDSVLITTPYETPTGDICDVDGEFIPLGSTVNLCGNAGSGTVTFDGTCYEYTPDDGFIGLDRFCIEICDGSNCQQVIVRVDVKSNDVVIHTGLSPNGDDTNDELIIENIESFPDNKVRIYNRWGNLVYKADSYVNSDPWKGDFEGAILPDGTYFIVLEYGNGIRMSDYIVIMR